ncbi:receptor-like protein 19 [Papaver somniferum]|uniref:receptor-like protein 19 n=1 Tax=Papaver somniferum TaxID=3469 RepID=UPI000E705639|nr:receptor-like protein 19 [Papaver somniferum]
MTNYLEATNHGDVQLHLATKGIMIQIDQLNDYISVIDLSSNHLHGNIPKEITLLSSLNLSRNHFSDDIPESIGNLSGLQSLDKLSERIPQSLAVIETLAKMSYCVDILQKKVRNDDANPANELDEADQENAKEKLLVYDIVALGFAVGFWGLFFVLYLKKHKWWFPYWRIVDYVVVKIMDYIQ